MARARQTYAHRWRRDIESEDAQTIITRAPTSTGSSC
jgi:hypothetical protein